MIDIVLTIFGVLSCVAGFTYHEVFFVIATLVFLGGFPSTPIINKLEKKRAIN